MSSIVLRMAFDINFIFRKLNLNLLLTVLLPGLLLLRGRKLERLGRFCSLGRAHLIVSIPMQRKLSLWYNWKLKQRQLSCHLEDAPLGSSAALLASLFCACWLPFPNCLGVCMPDTVCQEVLGGFYRLEPPS
eukprot:1138676-Pelagomonas_calceolata.AAC.2